MVLLMSSGGLCMDRTLPGKTRLRRVKRRHSLARRVNRTLPSPNASRVEVLDDGRLLVMADFLPLLRANELNTFATIMAREGGKMMRSVPGRSTVKLELKRPDGGVQIAFLKRYEPEYLSLWKKLLRFVHWPGADDEAMHEWRAIEQLSAHGFNTAAPMAVGQERHGGVVTRSFLLTAEIEGGVAAHNYVRTLGAKPRRELAGQIGELTRRFHGAGFAHKDFYLSHIFVVPQPSTLNPQLFFIDLQRLVRPRFLRERWRVKDLAQLGYGARLAGATRADLLHFYKNCFQCRQLEASDRQLIGRIQARIHRLQRRRPKFDVIWDKPGVHPRNV